MLNCANVPGKGRWHRDASASAGTCNHDRPGGTCVDDSGQHEANSVSRGAYRNPRAQSAVVWHPAPDAGVPTSATRAATHEAQVILQLQVQVK